MKQLGAAVANPLWEKLCAHIETTYALQPQLQYSKCSMASGWNVKYRKAGRALCTLYPEQNKFTCLVSVGAKEAPEAELLLGSFDPYLQALYNGAKPFNGGRWLMIEVTSEEILENELELLRIRISPKK